MPLMLPPPDRHGQRPTRATPAPRRRGLLASTAPVRTRRAISSVTGNASPGRGTPPVVVVLLWIHREGDARREQGPQAVLDVSLTPLRCLALAGSESFRKRR